MLKRDHPRSRGVYANHARSMSGLAGSSPLARGLRVGGAAYVETIGIIPARAGFTTQPRLDSSRLGDHPRSRGVYLRRLARLCARRGSSPLARGLPHQGHCHAPHRRIIPARAGFTQGQ